MTPSRLQIDLARDLPLVEFDAVLIERVLCNLRENAAKYAPAGTPIVLAGRHPDDVGRPFAEVFRTRPDVSRVLAGAFEMSMRTACARHFPPGEFSIYVHGHSTGGPYVSMLSQRVENVAGVIAIENSTFGYINEKKHQWGGHVGKIEGYKAVAEKSAESWQDPFNDLYIRTWRDLARYRGSEALGQEGPQALMRLPWLMEEIFEAWDIARKRPQFKAEYMVTHNILGALREAAGAYQLATGGRLEEVAIIGHGAGGLLAGAIFDATHSYAQSFGLDLVLQAAAFAMLSL